MHRKEAIALLVELGNNQLVTPSFVILEKSMPDKYQLKIKGYYNLLEIGVLLRRRFSLEENENCLTISSL